MSIPLRAALLGFILAAPCVPAVAGELRCTSVNGNINCVGPDAASCQTVNGHTVCSAPGVVQSFGGADDDRDDDDQDAPVLRHMPWRTPSCPAC